MNLILQQVDATKLIRSVAAMKNAVALYAADVNSAVAWAKRPCVFRKDREADYHEACEMHEKRGCHKLTERV
ncbi:MAG: hypothetical protein IKU71_03230 [Kiritimatiellae bacterium]|nr:hypothetical protein [Kiritimatiellia bacterium]